LLRRGCNYDYVSPFAMYHATVLSISEAFQKGHLSLMNSLKSLKTDSAAFTYAKIAERAVQKGAPRDNNLVIAG